ncbi:hypothetical protein BRADI_3g48487v3 [Brachypodium distachyon]|uniref:Uncharacterized protein n=1 Tax=Brachypodium distachyon TaxID=15368 RepID=A0A2K2D429_BRADI|nr:hypothetical protein BRADI_3g48487v3 [Brachypodium distachyon]
MRGWEGLRAFAWPSRLPAEGKHHYIRDCTCSRWMRRGSSLGFDTRRAAPLRAGCTCGGRSAYLTVCVCIFFFGKGIDSVSFRVDCGRSGDGSLD